MQDYDKANFLRSCVETYYDVQKTRVGMGNRVQALDNESSSFLGTIENRAIKLEDDIEKEVKKRVNTFEFYSDYLDEIKGIGPLMGAVILSELALPRRFERIPERDGDPREHEKVISETDDGYMVESPPCLKVAEKVSQLWSYCGYGSPDEKRQKGESISHNPFIKKKLHTIAESFLKSRSHYRKFYDDAKDYYQENRDWTDGHCHNAAYRIVKKLFLSHVWEVWRTWEGLKTPEPYVFDKKGHDGYIKPFIEDESDIIYIL